MAFVNPRSYDPQACLRGLSGAREKMGLRSLLFFVLFKALAHFEEQDSKMTRGRLSEPNAPLLDALTCIEINDSFSQRRKPTRVDTAS
jgi:hypothetical protein